MAFLQATCSISILFLLTIFIHDCRSSSTPFECVRTANCSCYIHQAKYDFYCPSDEEGFNFFVEPKKQLNFPICNSDKWNLDIFPNLNVGEIEYLQFRMCPFPDTFKMIMDRFGAKNPKTLKFDNNSDNKDKTISRHLFDGLSGLESLILSENRIRSITDDAFDDLGSLTMLDLRANNLELKPTILKNLRNLTLLDLSENHLTHIPDGLFDNLLNLKFIYLRKNDLTDLQDNLFQPLNDLRLLVLSFNKIQKLNSTTFVHLKNIVEIDLTANNISEISENTFSENRKLTKLLIKRNPHLASLPVGLFSNLKELETVDLSENNLEFLPSKLFENDSSIQNIILRRNMLTDIPENIFDGLKSLNKLDLSYNKIASISAQTFYPLTNLKNLMLQYNSLTNITNDIFSELTMLEEINLEMNAIHTVDEGAFQRNEYLKIVRMGHNEIKYSMSNSPFRNCIYLEELFLNNNLMEEFAENIITKNTLRLIDMKYNRIKNISSVQLQKLTPFKLILDFRYNNITVVELDLLEVLATSQDKLLDAASKTPDDDFVIYIAGNPIECDCKAFHLSRYVEGSMYPEALAYMQIEVGDATCKSPNSLAGFPISKLKSKMITCSLTQFYGNSSLCPESCICETRPWDKSLIYDCSNGNISNVPNIILPGGNLYNQTEVHLEGNHLTQGPVEGMGYEKTTRLVLSNNKIQEIKWLPPNIQVLHFDHNNISFLSYDILKQLNESTVKNISLDHNPWRCDCDAVNLTNFLKENLLRKQYNPKSITCAQSGKSLINLNINNLCPTYLSFVLGISMSLLIIMFLAALSIALYYRYQQEIKVWLFAHDMFLWFITEEEVDKDKLYDAFISYSHKDEDFVTEKLLPILEDGPHPYKLCLHFRDWIPGEFISKQIAQSVENSRRTVVILSESFLESVWGKMEFRTAHTQAMSEGRARVIIILYGNVNLDNLDDELKSYLRTNTYLKWDDPWFWNKLRYALPHPQRAFDKKVQRNNNIMLTLHDKLDLITTPTTPNAGSTPPAVSLDPLLIKDNPLDFSKTELRSTAPAAEA
ncbi:protein toll [Agrilus planipennis]|uniref:Protein toll n=2 Tax=Agrilus planipennis TaxID=224129 RepID=A0A7F5QV01_AGRPL|nr:protein toll [Agrilus planipennis]